MALLFFYTIFENNPFYSYKNDPETLMGFVKTLFNIKLFVAQTFLFGKR